MTIAPEDALSALPPSLRGELIKTFNQIVTRYVAGDYEPSELNGGKFCEVVYSILRGHIDGKFPAKSKKPPRFINACADFEKADSKLFPRSVRIHVPRVLVALYEVRNNRSVGHVGGDVDPNHMDAVWVVSSAKWVLAELVRIFHDLDVSEATEVVEALTDRTSPAVWSIGDQRRIMDTSISVSMKTLILLHSAGGTASSADLIGWIEYSNASRYRKTVLRDLHLAREVEFDSASDLVHLSPSGVAIAETALSVRP